MNLFALSKILILANLLWLTSCGGNASINDYRSENSDKSDDGSEKKRSGDYETGDESEPVAGGYLTLTRENARLRCDYQQSETAHSYKTRCSLVAVDKNGNEFLTGNIAPNLSFQWFDLEKVGGTSVVASCETRFHGITQECLITGVASYGRYMSQVTINESVGKNVITQKLNTDLLLPLEVATGGFAPFMSSFASHGDLVANSATALTASGPVRMGFSKPAFEPFKAPFKTMSLCESRLGIFFTSGRQIYRYRNWKVEHYSGGFQLLKETLKDRFAVNYASPETTSAEQRRVYIACTDSGLYVSDPLRNRILFVPEVGEVKIVAGITDLKASGPMQNNVPASTTRLSTLAQLVTDNQENIYFVENNSVIRKVDTKGMLSTIVGGGPTQISTLSNGDALAVSVSLQTSLTLNYEKDKPVLYFGENTIPGGVYKLVDGRNFVHVAGNRTPLQQQSPPDPAAPYDARQINLGGVLALAFDKSGDLYIGDTNRYVRKVSQGKITSIAGNGLPYNMENFSLIEPDKVGFYPSALLARENGEILIADLNAEKIFKYQPKLKMQLFAGNFSAKTPSKDLYFSDLILEEIQQIEIGKDGSLYLVETRKNVVYKVDPPTPGHPAGGLVRIFAGTYESAGAEGDGGPANKARLNQPYAILLDDNDTLYISDGGNNRIRAVKNGMITRFAGSSHGFSGDGGLAINAKFAGQSGLAFDKDGNMLVADYKNHAIRKIDRNGIVSTIAGNGGTCGAGGDYDPNIIGSGNPLNAGLNYPADVGVGSDGSIYIAERFSHRIRRIKDGIISTYAGKGPYRCNANHTLPYFSEDSTLDAGPPDTHLGNEIYLNEPNRLTVHGDNVFVVDRVNRAVRLIKPNVAEGATSPSIITDFFSNRVSQCGSGVLADSSALKGIPAKIKANLSVICAAFPVAVKVRDRCSQGEKEVRMVISQKLEDYTSAYTASDSSANVISIKWPCGTKF